MTKIEHAANVAVILTCIAAVAHIALDRTPKAPHPYKAGDEIADSAGLGFHNAKRTLILFESSTCHFCRESLGFYSRLTDLAHRTGTRFVAVTYEDTEANQKFLGSNGVTSDAVVALKNSKLKVFGTPTLILVGNDGRVISSWVGKLAPEKESEVTGKLLYTSAHN